MVRPKNGARYFGAMKSASDLSTDQLLQLAVHRLFARLNIVSEIDRLRAAYADRAVMMLAAMEKHFRPDVQWTKPKGGFFIWVTLPEGANAGEMLRQAMAGGVTYAAGQAFFANGKGQNTLRLCYSQASHDQIETGIQRLAAVIDRHLEEKGIRSDARVPVR
jgi:DNA-binding transcriptional MocR family regulator